MKEQFAKSVMALAIMLALVLVGCGGGADTDNAPGMLTFSARGEANRVAAAYRVQRDLATLLTPYVHDAGTLIGLHNRTASCLFGGTVLYTYNAGPGGGVEQRFDATFTNCAETIGIITGTLTVMWNASQNNPSAGIFTPLFFGTIGVDGVQYNYIRPSTASTNYNTASGVQQSELSVYSLSGVQPPTGPSAKMQHLAFTVQTQPGLSTVALLNTFNTITANTGDAGVGAAGVLRNPGTCTVNRVAASAAVLGLGTPQSCSWSYSRSNRSGPRETLAGTAVVSSGLLNLSVEGGQTHRSVAAQYDWPTILMTPNYDMDGE